MVQRAIKLNIPLNEEIIKTVKQYNTISNLHIQKAFELKTNSKKKLHHALYRQIRNDFPTFPSALIQCARDNAIEMLKGNGYRKKTLKKPISTIRFDNRTSKVFLESDQVQLTLIGGRKRFEVVVPNYFSKYINWKVRGVQVGVHHSNKLCKVHVIVENGEITPTKNKKVLGIDLGLKNFIACSDGTLIKSSKIRGMKRKYAHLRRCLQKKGTRSSKRKLKKVRGRERRFMQDFNHRLSKEIVNKDFGVFALEELKNIKKGKKGKRFNRMRSNWAYLRFRQFLSYKAESLGKRIILVDPRVTSQRCSKCGFIASSNRNKGFFHCESCGFSENADLNASFNISQVGQALLEQAVVNQPNVVINEGDSLHQTKSPEINYKPFPLGRGS